MNKTLLMLLTALALAGVSRADDDDNEQERGGRGAVSPQLVNGPTYKTYQQECAGCHMAYPPGMLPPASWQRIMGSLDKHYCIASHALNSRTVGVSSEALVP